MTLKGHYALCFKTRASFGAHFCCSRLRAICSNESRNQFAKHVSILPRLIVHVVSLTGVLVLGVNNGQGKQSRMTHRCAAVCQSVCIVSGWWGCRDVDWCDVMKWVDKHETAACSTGVRRPRHQVVVCKILWSVVCWRCTLATARRRNNLLPSSVTTTWADNWTDRKIQVIYRK